MLVAVYVRMSTDKQESSIERQLDQIKKHCATKGYTIYRVYEDQALKGHDWERPAFIELMRDASKKKFQGIVVDEESRFSRHEPRKFIAKIADPLADLGIWLESVNEGRQNWDDMAGLIITTVKADKSSGESLNLGRRVLSKWNLLAEQGKCYLGRKPYGYEFVLNEAEERIGLIPDGDKADHTAPANIVRWLFKTYISTNSSLKSLAAELTARAVPTAQGGRWRACTIQKILRNRVYCGDYVFNRYHSGKFYRRAAGGELVKSTKKVREGCKRRVESNQVKDWVIRTDTHEPLVSRDDFAAVQAKLVKNATQKASPTELRKYPFLRTLICSHCGAWMVAHKKSAWKHPRYICGSNHHFGTCRGYSVAEDVILSCVMKTLEEEFLNPEHLGALIEQARELEDEQKTGNEAADVKKAMSKLDASIKHAEGNLALVPQERVRPILDKIAEWEAKKGELERRLQDLGSSPTEELDELVRFLQTLLWKWREALQEDDMEDVHLLIREAISKVELRFETVMRKVKPRHRLVGGTLYFSCGKPTEVSVRLKA